MDRYCQHSHQGMAKFDNRKFSVKKVKKSFSLVLSVEKTGCIINISPIERNRRTLIAFQPHIFMMP